jgi:hypothetical protein
MHAVVIGAGSRRGSSVQTQCTVLLSRREDGALHILPSLNAAPWDWVAGLVEDAMKQNSKTKNPHRLSGIIQRRRSARPVLQS